MKSLLVGILIALGITQTLPAADALAQREWTVDGVAREALVYLPPPTDTNAHPLIFAFHGHGGSMRNAANSFHLQTLWPEAIVVYMQGLNTPGRLTDPDGKKPGWQSRAGAQGDRDLKFFDAVLASLEKENDVDTKRIYATGHSNGGGFTYLLWAQRGNIFAAVAPSAAVYPDYAELKPKPVLHVAGDHDPLVKFEWQQMMMNQLRKLNECGEGQSWESATNCTYYPSAIGAPVVTLIFPGVHQFPPSGPECIVKFFQQHALP